MERATCQTNKAAKSDQTDFEKSPKKQDVSRRVAGGAGRLLASCRLIFSPQSSLRWDWSTFFRPGAHFHYCVRSYSRKWLEMLLTSQWISLWTHPGADLTQTWHTNCTFSSGLVWRVHISSEKHLFETGDIFCDISRHTNFILKRLEAEWIQN